MICLLVKGPKVDAQTHKPTDDIRPGGLTTTASCLRL